MTSTEIRAALAAIESAATEAGERLVAAETAHQAAIRRTVTASQNPITSESAHADVVLSEAALADARIAFERANVSRDVARKLLDEAIAREIEEAQAVARDQIEAKLGELAKLASEADADAANLAGKLIRLRAMEVSIHRATGQAFRQPWSAPMMLSVAAPIAVYLRGLMNGLTPDFCPWVAEMAEKAARNVRAALS